MSFKIEDLQTLNLEYLFYFLNENNNSEEKLLVIYNGSTIVDEQILTVEETQTIPIIQVPKDYYLIMYDLNSSVNPSRVHWFKNYYTELFEYQGPAPPINTGMHQYIFILCKGIPPFIPTQRDYFNPNPYYKNIISKTYFLSNIDS